MEPLLKDEEETLKVGSNAKSKKNIPLITTIVITIIVGMFTFKTVKQFYWGFKYYDMAHPERETTTSDDIALIDNNSLLLKELYSYIDFNEMNILSNIYTGNVVNINDLNNYTKLEIVFNALGLNCNNLSINKTYDEIKEVANKIFTDITFLDNLNGIQNSVIDNYSINYDNVSNTYNINLNACSDTYFVSKSMINAYTQGDYLYIEEAFGYFENIDTNTYNVYSNINKNSGILTTFTDTLSNREFNDYDTLKQYKWTFLKINDTYFVVSIMPL